MDMLLVGDAYCVRLHPAGKAHLQYASGTSSKVDLDVLAIELDALLGLQKIIEDDTSLAEIWKFYDLSDVLKSDEFQSTMKNSLGDVKSQYLNRLGDKDWVHFIRVFISISVFFFVFFLRYVLLSPPRHFGGD